MGRTPVTVVCGGAKAILDLSLTLEVLETHGVPVLGYQTAELPAFYSRNSGLPVDARIDAVADVADIIATRNELGLETGTLVTVPVPAADEWPMSEAVEAIEQAGDRCRRAGTSPARSLRPFLLGHISNLSGGRSKRANRSLLLNNARVAAQIAVALSRR